MEYRGDISRGVAIPRRPGSLHWFEKTRLGMPSLSGTEHSIQRLGSSLHLVLDSTRDRRGQQVMFDQSRDERS